MIDLHCHILPGIDDGPPTMEAALDLARAAVASGIGTTVATPHVTWDHQHNTASAIAAAVEALSQELARAGIPLTVLPGAEIAMTRVADLADEELAGLRLGDSPYLLVECPLSPVAAGFGPLIDAVRAKGHEVLLAHPERCPAFQRDPQAYASLVADGVLGQVTAGALVGRFGPPALKLGRRLLHEGLAHDVSTDAHGADHRRPTLREDLAAAGLGDATAWLADEVPAAILAGRPLPPAPVVPPEPSRGLLARLRVRG